MVLVWGCSFSIGCCCLSRQSTTSTASCTSTCNRRSPTTIAQCCAQAAALGQMQVCRACIKWEKEEQEGGRGRRSATRKRGNATARSQP